MIVIYNFYLDACKAELAKNQYATTNYTFKKMNIVRRDILRMFTTFIQYAPLDKPVVNQKILPHLCDVLKNYKVSPPVLRDAEVILLFAKGLHSLGAVVNELIPNILDCIFGGTLELISVDFASNPDHRHNFFVFLKSTVEKCFEALLSIPAEQLETIINCMVWSIRHQLISDYEVGLESLLALLSKVNTSLELANQFYVKYYMRIFNDVLYVLIDKLHENGFELQMQIMRILISVLPRVDKGTYDLVRGETGPITTRQREVRPHDDIHPDV